MTTSSDDSSIREAIERRIDEFLASDDTRFDEARVIVREHRFLPLYFGWLATLGIRSDGSFVRWDHEIDRDAVKPASDPRLNRLAICQGARRYPELAALTPARPEAARTCETCGGAGELTGAPQIVCSCGGVGWVVDGEEPTESDVG